ncbi:MAG: MFS transporter [Dehalococcoidia bacterium]
MATPELPTPPAPATSQGYRGRISSWRGTFTSLSEPEYAWYFAGNIAFFMGMQMQMLLRGFLAYDLTGTAASLGIMAAAMAFPMLIASPFGGLVADRVNKRTLLITTQSAAAFASLIIAVLIITDLIQFWHLIAISVATGGLFSFNMPARQALVPLLVPQHKLMNAISLQMGGMNLTRIVAPALGGLLIAPIGIGWVYMLTFVMFGLAVASEFHLPKIGMGTERVRQSFRTEFTGGFVHIKNDPTLRLLMTMALLMPLFGFPVQQMLPVFAEEVFDNGGVGLGLLASATGVGGLAGAMVSANLDRQPHKGRLMLLGGVLMGGFLLAFGLAGNFVLALVFLGAMGVGQMLFQATNNTAIQTDLPPEVRGRVMAVMMMSFGVMPLGAIPVTIAADSIGAPSAVALSAVAMLVVLALCWAISPRLRNLRFDNPGTAELSPIRAAQMVAEGKITRDEADRLTGLDRFRASPPRPGPKPGPGGGS